MSEKITLEERWKSLTTKELEQKYKELTEKIDRLSVTSSENVLKNLEEILVELAIYIEQRREEETRKRLEEEDDSY